MNVGDVKIKLILESGQFDSSIDKSTSKIKEVEIATNKASVSTVKFSSHLQNFALQFQGISSAYQILKSTIASCISEFMRSEVALSKLSRGLDNVGAGVDAFKKLNTQASELQKITPFADDEITNAQAMLTTFQKSAEEIQILTPRILDLAAAYMKSGDSSMDLQQVAVMLGKVNEDTVGQLKRVGVAFNKEQEAKLKSLQGTEQAIMLSEILDQNFKGLAETVGNTTAGSFARLQNSIGDMKETFGSVFSKMLKPTLDELNQSLSEQDQQTKILTLDYELLGSQMLWIVKHGGNPLIMMFAGIVAGGKALSNELLSLVGLADDTGQSFDFASLKAAEFSGNIVTLDNKIRDLYSSLTKLPNKALEYIGMGDESMFYAHKGEVDKGTYRVSSPSRPKEVTIEKDAVDELINSLKEQYEIYKSDEEIKKRLNQTGLDELAIIQKLTSAIADTTYTTEQILKLDKYRGELADVILKKQQELNELRQQEIDQLQTITDSLERGFSEREKRRKSESINLDIQQAEFIENKYLSIAERIRIEFRKAMLEASEETDPILKKRKEEIAIKKQERDLAQLEREKYDYILDALSQGTSAASSIAQLLGIGAEHFIFKLLNGLSNALNFVTQIKELLEAIGVVKSVVNFITAATGFGSVAVGGIGGGGIGLPDSVGNIIPGSSMRVMQVPYIATVSAKGKEIFVTLQKEKAALQRRTI